MGGKVLDLPEIRAYHDGKAEGIEEGKAEGALEATLESIRKIITNLGMTPEQAMEALGIPKEEYDKYIEKI